MERWQDKSAQSLLNRETELIAENKRLTEVLKREQREKDEIERSINEA